MKEESLKSYLNYFTTELAYVIWTLDASILAHLTNGVLPETPFWEELQQKECRSVSEYFRKANKFLKLENSKEDKGHLPVGKMILGEAVKSNKGKEKKEVRGKVA